MSTEIERKFLVVGNDWKSGTGVPFSQGYLNADKQRTVRVRIAGNKGFLTIKGMTQGISRAEFEYEIPVADAEQLLKLCDGPLIQKVRYLVSYKGSLWEVDEFFGDNAGLVVAEIELESEAQLFERPDWVGKEVSDDVRYFNSSLAKHPFSQWAV
jgi:CYTH domain-containing protein